MQRARRHELHSGADALCACRWGGWVAADRFERGGGVHADGWGGRAGTGTGPGPARRGVVESEAGEAADEFECGDVTGEAMVDEASPYSCRHCGCLGEGDVGRGGRVGVCGVHVWVCVWGARRLRARGACTAPGEMGRSHGAWRGGAHGAWWGEGAHGARTGGAHGAGGEGAHGAGRAVWRRGGKPCRSWQASRAAG